MSIDYPENRFWEYSLKVYGGEGVSKAFINIQDRHEMDVNLLLLSIWVGGTGRGTLSLSQFSQLIEVSQLWNREIVCKLRAVRDRLKDPFQGFSEPHTEEMRKSVLGLEIECERIEHLALSSVLGDIALGPDQPDSGSVKQVITNISNYFTAKNCVVNESDLEDFLVILAAAYPLATRHEIREEFLG